MSDICTANKIDCWSMDCLVTFKMVKYEKLKDFICYIAQLNQRIAHGCGSIFYSPILSHGYRCVVFTWTNTTVSTLLWFLGAHLRHREVSRLGVERLLQAYPTARATLDLSPICSLCCSLWKGWILNPLS